MMNSREQGHIAENFTMNHYLSNGYRLIQQNYRYKKTGEIDLILQQPLPERDGCLVFCEVKYRKNSNFSPPSLAVNKEKQKRIRTVASIFILQHPEFSDNYIRFDVAEVTQLKAKMYVNIIENAF